MGLIEEIDELGAATEDALSRFMDKAELYERMLKKFPKVIEDAPVLPYLESEDFDMALSNAHTLKGVAGNLSLTQLYENYSEMMLLLRGGDTRRAKELLLETMDIQQKYVDCINKYV